MKKKIPYSIVRKSWISFTWRLVVGSHVEKSCWYKNKIWLAIKISAEKIHQRKLKFFNFFSTNFFCSVFWYCTIVFKLHMHWHKSWQNFSLLGFFSWMENGLECVHKTSKAAFSTSNKIQKQPPEVFCTEKCS